MRTLWIVSGASFVGAIASAWLDRVDATLLFAALGFGLIHLAESSFDWQRPITRRNWRRAVFEDRVPTTIVGKVGQFLCFLCLFGFFVATFR